MSVTLVSARARVLTWQEVLVGLYLLNDYRRCERPPSPGWFYRHGVLTGITAATTRRVAMRLARLETCIACDAPISLNSEGDHIVPVSRGGPPGVENYCPLCKSCNSSKSTRDLLEWWTLKGHPPDRLPADVIVAYCRLMLPRVAYERRLHEPAPDGVLAVFVELAAPLGGRHRRALWERIKWVVGRDAP